MAKRSPKQITPQTLLSDQPLAEFLIRLATEDDLRAQFSEDRASLLELFPNMSPESMKAILTRNKAVMRQRLALSNQNSSPASLAIRRAKKAKAPKNG